MNQGKVHRPLRELTTGGVSEIDRIKLDTTVGMIFSNAIAFSIILTTAAVLNAHGVTNINSATQAAEALRPLAGDFTFLLFALGIIGTGLLAIPVLAGSTAYAIGEGRKWPVGLSRKPKEAIAFYSVLALSVAIGIALNFTAIDPIKALYWSAVLNGIIAVPMMTALMVVASSRAKMGKFRAGWVLGGLGWLSTAVMAAAAITMIYVTFK
ncbi:MAG TPA: divalent metal cation transporter [Rhizomicrobium sp.]|nr:divalent metal cation transporter [Rhizomicrobium sp.]